MPRLRFDALTACIQMTADQRRSVLRGWKLPPSLLPVARSRHGFNPFTTQPTVTSSRLPTVEVVPDPDAVRHPALDELPWVDTDDFGTDAFVAVATDLLGWSAADATDELSRFLVGPDLANDAFAIFPDELARALSVVDASQVPMLGEQAAQYANLERDMCRAVLDRLVPFMRSAIDSGRDVFHWTLR